MPSAYVRSSGAGTVDVCVCVQSCEIYSYCLEKEEKGEKGDEKGMKGEEEGRRPPNAHECRIY